MRRPRRTSAPRPDAGRVRLLSVHVAHEDERCVLTPVGELDASTVHLLEDEVAKALSDETQRIVLDLSELSFMDSSGLRLLLQAHASRTDSERLSIVRGRPRVQRVFVLTNTESSLPFID